MKKFEIKKRTVVAFDKSAEIPSEMTDNVGGGARTQRRWQCESGLEPCWNTDWQVTCNTCESCDTCYSCNVTCNTCNTCNTCVAQTCGCQTQVNCPTNGEYTCNYTEYNTCQYTNQWIRCEIP